MTVAVLPPRLSRLAAAAAVTVLLLAGCTGPDGAGDDGDGASDGGGLGTGAWTAIILGGAGAIITAVILTRDDDEIVSPSR